MTTYHLRPARGWLNDPNGMVHKDGRWHVFFQHNPDQAVHDRIAWGHASSGDLLHWREHPVAFRPVPGGPDALGCWSGVYVRHRVQDHDRPTVVYTGIPDRSGRSTVCLRRGSPDLEVWGDPVVVAEQPEGVQAMRDPFVFEHGGLRWALLGAGLPDGTPAVLLFSCEDLMAWEYRGVWASGADPVLDQLGPADVWECPQLVPVGEGRAALVVSLHDRGVLGQVMAATGELLGAPEPHDAPEDGAAGQDRGEAPRLRPEVVQVLDTGDAFYAPQVAADPDQGAWVMGWVRHEGGKDLEQAGCMALPRRLVREGPGVLLRLDHRVAARLEPTLFATAPGWISHPGLGGLELPEGSRVYVDGDVTEIYRPGHPPHTTRHRQAWVL